MVRLTLDDPAIFSHNLPDDHTEKIQTPPDLVVKFQLIDIIAVILWLVLRLHFVYQRQIEG
jgi:hypothetical protein